MNGRVARTLNPKAKLGGPHVGFTCGGFDFVFFLLVSYPAKSLHLPHCYATFNSSIPYK
jgi:hypothetical protein